jgi:hypothetical protein
MYVAVAVARTGDGCAGVEVVNQAIVLKLYCRKSKGRTLPWWFCGVAIFRHTQLWALILFLNEADVVGARKFGYNYWLEK